MNIPQLKDTGLYPENAGHLCITTADGEHHTAYMVLGRFGGQAMVVEGTGPNKMTAIDHLVKQVKLMRDFMDCALHGAFWADHEAERNEQRAAAREAIKALMGGRASFELDAPKKKDDEGLS